MELKDKCEKCHKKAKTLVGMNGKTYCLKCFDSSLAEIGNTLRKYFPGAKATMAVEDKVTK